MMRTYARLRGLRRLMIPVPVLTPQLSSYWVNLVTPVPARIARPLIEGLRNEVVVRIPARPPRSASSRFLCRGARAGNRSDRPPRCRVHVVRRARRIGSGEPVVGHVREDDRRTSGAGGRRAADRIFAEVERFGGDAGWVRERALEDQGTDRSPAGARRDAPGSPRPRLSPRRRRARLWRVEEVRRPTLLRLRAEMKVPGRAWLQHEVTPTIGGSRLVQTVFFEPKGLPGLAYWYALYPVHGLIFRGTVRVLAERALRRAEGGPPTT